MSKIILCGVLLASGCRASAATPAPTSEIQGCPAPPPSYRAAVVPVLRENCFAMPPSGRPQLTEPERRTLLAWLGCKAPEN